MKDHYLIFDLGASNGRAIVAALENEKITFETVHAFDNRPVFGHNKEFFWDVLRLYSEIKIGIQKAVKAYGKITSMAIDTWGCDFGLIDQQGRLLANPLHYRDESQHDLATKLHSILSEEELFSLCGGPCNQIMGIYKLFSMKEQGFTEYREGSRLLMMPDIFNYLLTGKISNEFTNATMTLMTNQQTRDWEPKILEKLGLRTDILGSLSEPGTFLGMLREEVCQELEIEPISVIIPATHDTASAVAGIPLTETDTNWGYISLGTWCLAGLETEKPLMDPAIVKTQFGNEGGAAGKNLLLKNITGLWIIQQCRDKWNKDSDQIISWDEVCKQAEESPEQNAFIDVDDPRFGRFQADMPTTIREYCRQTGQDVPDTLGEIARCVYKSLAMKFKESFDAIGAIRNIDLNLLHAVGGGSKNALLCQWTANAMNVRVIAGPAETTAIGNLIFQLIANGKIQSIEEGRALCAQSHELTMYAPKDIEEWGQIHQNFLRMLAQEKQ